MTWQITKNEEGLWILTDGTREIVCETQEEALIALREVMAQAPPPPDGARRFRIEFTEGEATVDGRLIAENAINFDREPPLPLMMSTDGGGHETANLAGVIDTVGRDGSTIYGEGRFDESPTGAEAARLVGTGMLTTWSPDIGNTEVEVEMRDENGDILEDDADPLAMLLGPSDGATMLLKLTSGTLLGGTMVPFPALSSATISLAASLGMRAERGGRIRLLEATPEGRALVAGGFPVRPPEDWFTEHPDTAKGFTRAVQITDAGRIYGYIAPWGVCHTGMPGVCIEAPQSETDYAFFRTGSVKVDCADGCEIPTGVLTLGTGHAAPSASAPAAAEHYDNACIGVADIACGENEFGIWFSGALRPGVTDEQVRTIRALAVSGDWRNIGGRLELMAALCVNHPGFPMPRPTALVASGRQVSLLAAGWPRQVVATSPAAKLLAAFEAMAQKIVALEARLDRVEPVTRALRPDARDRIVASAARDDAGRLPRSVG